MMRKWGWQLCAALLFLAACGRKVPANLPGPAEHEVAYRQGLEAFRQATPEGYLRAADSFRRASTLSPSHCEYSLHLAESLLFLADEQKINWEESTHLVTEAAAITGPLRSAPGCAAFEPYLNRLRALTMVQLGLSRTDALDLLNQTIDLDPDNPMNWIALWKLNAKDPRVAILHAAQLAPDLALVQYELGNYRLDRKEYPDAKTAYERALALSPRHFRSLIGIAYSLSSVDFTADVEPYYRKAVDIAPTSVLARALMGDYYASEEETERALEQYRAAIDVNPRFFPADLGIGIVLLKEGRLDEAEQALSNVVVKTPKPGNVLARYYLGNLWLQRGDLVKAKAEYQESLNIVGNYTDSMYGLGSVFFREGKMDEALAQFDKIIQLSPEEYPDAYLSRGNIRSRRQQFTDAIADFGRAIEIYRQRIADLSSQAEKSESMGLLRKAEAERKQKARIEIELQQALDSRKNAGGGDCPPGFGPPLKGGD